MLKQYFNKIQRIRNIIYFMLIEETVAVSYVHRKEYRLTVWYVEKVRKGNVHGVKLQIMLDSKANNLIPKKLTAELEMEQEQLKQLYRQLTSPLMYIHRQHPRLTLLEHLSIVLKDTTSTFTSKEISTFDVAINYGYKYWRVRGEMEASGGTSQVQAYILQRSHQEVLIGHVNYHQLEINGESILQLEEKIKKFEQKWAVKKRKKKQMIKIQQKICNQLKRIVKQLNPTVNKDLSTFEANSELIPRLPITTLIIEKKERSLTKKEQLFRHIFLTELIASMIISQFGRNKRKQNKYRDGRMNYWYEDQQLQALRSCGHRLSEFRDHSVEIFHSPQQEDQSSDSSQSAIEEEDEGKKDDQENKVKNFEVQRVGKKIKRLLKGKKVNDIELENYIVMSGKDKSHINKRRYCLHQMTRETDKTQALINFVQLVFSAYWPKINLFTFEGETQGAKRKRMTYFMKKFKVKRQMASCLREYTRESFFHKVLNIGLRTLKEPHELTYLRLPFSHMFWSIRALYHRYKKAILQKKKEEYENKTIRFYRGCQMREEEIKHLKQNIGAFIEMEGFLSTTSSEEAGLEFCKSIFMIIEVPMINMNGIHDNGFAHLRKFSEHPNEDEVLFNAFNMFKILSLKVQQKNNIEYCELIIEFGGIKQVEEKVRKSQNLLESQFLMKVEEEKIQSVKHLLSMKEEQMTSSMVEQLKEKLSEQEKKLKQWKDTLNKQEKQEFANAYEQLSQWEQELFDSNTHQEHTMWRIDNYGQLLVTLGQYDRGIGYCKRMVRKVQGEKASEGWQWMKTPCLPHKEQVHRLLLAKCYKRQCRYVQQVRELQKVKQLYLCMNMDIPPYHHSYVQLLTQLAQAYQHLGKQQYHKYNNQCLHMRIRYRMENANKPYDFTNDQGEKSREVQKQKLNEDIFLKGIERQRGKVRKIIVTSYREEKQKEIQKLSVSQLLEGIKKQKEKLKQISVHAQGKKSEHYQSQQYRLILMLSQQQQNKQKQKRDYQQMKVQTMKYFANRKHSQHTSTTIQLFHHILKKVDSSKSGKKWLVFVCKQLISFLTSHIYHHEQISIIYQCMKLCRQTCQWISLRQLERKLITMQISCQLSSLHYDMMMMIFVWMWSISKQCMAWITNTWEQVYRLHQQYRREIGQALQNFVRFPHQIANWRKLKRDLDGIGWGCDMDVIKGCLNIEVYYNHTSYPYRNSRQIEHLSLHMQQNLSLQREIFQARRVLGSKLEVQIWQYPCEVWNAFRAEYGVAKFMINGEVMMLMQYLHHHHPYYRRVVSSTMQLHLPREGQQKLKTLIQHIEYKIAGPMGQEGERMIRNVRRKHHDVGRQYNRKERVQKVGEKPVEGKRQQEIIIHSNKRQQQAWKQVQLQMYQHTQLLLEGRLDTLQRAKQYCQLSITHRPDHRVAGLWDGYQRGLVHQRMHTILTLHGRGLPLPAQRVWMGEAQSLTRLMRQQIVKEIKGCYFQQHEYLIPTFKALLYQECLPIDLMHAMFYHDKNYRQLIEVLQISQWKQYLQYEFQHHYPNTELLSSLSHLTKNSIFAYIEYYRENSGTKYNKECMRYGILRISVDRSELHPSLIQILSPIIHYRSIDKKQLSNKAEDMKNGYEALVEAYAKSNNCLHYGWWIRWWEKTL